MAEQKMDKMELKENITHEQLLHLLQRWTKAIQNKEDLDVMVRNEECTIPFKALEQGKIELEYEIKNGEYEFEIELKWR